MPFAHWYLDGNTSDAAPMDELHALAYADLEPLRTAVVAKVKDFLAAWRGTEARRSALAQLRPEDVGLTSGGGARAVMDYFKLSLLSQGSGTQFLSTTFVQWAAREVLRRAQPVTLLARFGPRMTQRALNQHLNGLPNVAVEY